MPDPKETKDGKQREEQVAQPTGSELITARIIEEEMKESYLNYAMSVIVGRALPDVRDGLKPVHRRILYAMSELGLVHNKPFKKSARIVGEVLGKFHPHGDTAVYDSLVRMVQTFSLRYPLVDGQGNFGSMDGDSAAAMRYTEARLTKIAEEMLSDIDKQTVDFMPNFDGSLDEPVVLPSKIPNLLINGSSGIAVGMATNIPPHNLSEVCSGCAALIDNPEISIEELSTHITGPDFPTGGIICGRRGIKEMFATGRGKIVIRAKTSHETVRNRECIVLTEIPYMVNKAMLIEQIAELVKDKKIQGISDLRDESNKKGVRVIIELKRDASYDVVLNQLYAHTRVQQTFGTIMLALVDNAPQVLTLKETLVHFIQHRKVVITRQVTYDLTKAKEKAHLLEGLIVALDHLDEAIELIKNSSSTDAAKTALITAFALSEKQSAAILDMKLQKLTGLEQGKIREEHAGLLVTIKELEEILASEQRIYGIIRTEMLQLKEQYNSPRRTEILDIPEEEMDIEDLIEKQDVVITVSHLGYIKRLPIDTYREQKRGGKGIVGANTKDEDFIETLFIANTHSYILCFSDKGQLYWLKVYKIPEGSRQASGKAIVNLLELSEGEKITAMVPIDVFDENHYLLMCTKQGIVKKTSLVAYSRPRQGGIIGITLDGDDKLVEVLKTDGKKEIIIATKGGMAVRFHESDVRPTGRASMGVKGITLEKDDGVIGMVIASASEAKTLLTVTENGYGKRTLIADYRLIRRGGSGVINIQCSDRNGKVISIKSVTSKHSIMLISKEGILIRIPAQDISIIGRNTQGVRLMKMGENDKVVAATKIVDAAEGELPDDVDGDPDGDNPLPTRASKEPDVTFAGFGLSPEEEAEFI